MADGIWIPIEQLASELHCSERTVETLRTEGIFRGGKHYYAVGAGKHRCKIVYSLDRCRAALLQRTVELESSRQVGVTYDEEHLDELIKEVRDGD